MNNSQNQTLKSYLLNRRGVFPHYITTHKDSIFVIKYTLYALGPIPWVEHLHLFHGPTTDTFYALFKTNCKMPGGVGDVRALKNSQNIVDN